MVGGTFLRGFIREQLLRPEGTILEGPRVTYRSGTSASLQFCITSRGLPWERVACSVSGLLN